MTNIESRLRKAESAVSNAPGNMRAAIDLMKRVYLGEVSQEENDQFNSNPQFRSLNIAEVCIIALHEIEKQDRIEGTHNLRRVYERMGLEVEELEGSRIKIRDLGQTPTPTT